jgi:glycopeptide antibiotics resistance protein
MTTATGRKKHPGLTNPDRWTRVWAIVYLLVIIWVLLFKIGVQFSYMDERRVNLVPFRQVFAGQGRLDLTEMVLNVLIFVPLGLYTAIIFRRWTLGTRVLFVFLVSALFEALQYVLRIGAFDATDIANNSLGGLIGLLLYMVMERILNNPLRAHRLLNMLAATGTTVVVVLLVLLRLNMLPIRYQ